MKTVRIDCTKIKDFRSFHNVFAEVMGFPDFYGKNMNAWIDCMCDVDDPDAGMTSVHVSKGEVLVLVLDSVDTLKENAPEVFEAFVSNLAFVNFSRIELGEEPVLTFSFHSVLKQIHD